MKKMGLEFGSPTTLLEAASRIPSRSHPLYALTGGPYEHCTHLREEILYLAEIGCEELPLENRIIPLETEDLRLLFQTNSFRRNLTGNETTVNWSFIEKNESAWSKVLPSGDNEWRWWQITTFFPNAQIGDFNLYCIETNEIFKQEKILTRFNNYSEFTLVFANQEEISLLKKILQKVLV